MNSPRKLLVSVLMVLAIGSFAVGQTAEPTRSYASIDVTLYTTSWCPYCTRARELLNELGVSLTEYDIEKDPGKHAEMMEKSGGSRGVPVIDIEGVILRGYSADAIRQVVERQRRR